MNLKSIANAKDNVLWLNNTHRFLAKHGEYVALGLLIVTVGIINIVWLAQDTRPQPDWDSNTYLINTLRFIDDLEKPGEAQFWELIAGIGVGGRPPLYQLLAVPFILLFGRSADAALVVNILYGAILLLAVYGIGKLALNGRAGLLAALLVAAYPPIIVLSRIYRTSFTLPVCVALSLWLLLLLLKTRSVKIAWLFGASLAFGLLNHPHFLYVLSIPTVVFGCYMLFLQTDPKRPSSLRATPGWLLKKLRHPFALYGLLPASLITMGLALPWYLTEGKALLASQQRLAAVRETVVTRGFDHFSPSFWWYALTMPGTISYVFSVLFIIGLALGVIRRRLFTLVLVVTFLAAYILFSTQVGALAWKRYVALLPVIAALTAIWIVDLRNRLLSAVLTIVCVAVAVFIFSVVTWGVQTWSRPIAIVLGAPLDTDTCSGRMFVAFCPDPARDEEWPVSDILRVILDDPACQERTCDLTVVPQDQDFGYFLFDYHLALDFPDLRVRVRPALLIAAGEKTPDLNWLLSDYTVYIPQWSQFGYRGAVNQVLQDPPRVFSDAHQDIASFAFPRGWTARLIKRTGPLTIEEAEVVIQALNLTKRDATLQRQSLDASMLVDASRRAVNADPDNPDLWLDLARAYRANNQPRDAVDALEQVISLAPDPWARQVLVAHTYRSLGRIDQAIAIYQQFLETDPNHAAAHLGLAVAYDAQGLTADAVREFQTATKIIPQSEWDEQMQQLLDSFKQQRLAKVEELLNDGLVTEAFDSAMQTLNLATLTIEEQAELARSVGNQLFNQGETARAIHLLNQVAPDTNDARVWVLLGRAHNSEGNADSAVAAYEQALVLEPKHYWANHLLARLYAKRGEWETVVQMEQVALEVANTDERRVDSGITLVEAYWNLGHQEDACAVLQQLEQQDEKGNTRVAELNELLVCQP